MTETTQESPIDARTTFRRVKKHFSSAAALTAKFTGQGAVEATASGSRVTLSDGRSMLDFGSYAVTLLGHRNESIVDAVRAQLDAMPTSTRYVQSPVAPQAAEAITEYLGGSLNRVYFGCNGADAIEVSIKLARLATGRSTVIAVKGAFHGKTLGALALTHNERFRSGLEDVLPGVVHVDGDDPEAVAKVVAEQEVAAVIFEPVQAENGVTPLDTDILTRWATDAHAHGAFVIADEIQVGLRRYGDRSVALAAGVPVDAVLLGKPLGGGVVPVSAAVGTDELFAPLMADPTRHSATFTGHPLCTAVVPAALAAIERHVEDGERVAERMADGLATIRERHADVITDVRGSGLIYAIDFTTPAIAGEVQTGLAQRGLVISPCLSRPASLRLLPPMVASDEDVKEAMALLSDAIAEATANAT